MGIEYISALTALAAVILSPLIAFLTIYYQSRISVLSASRQKWIDSFRDAISEYSGLMNSINQARSLDHQTYADIYPKIKKSLELESKILLLLNPNESKHKKISELTTRGRVAVFGVDEHYHPNIWNGVWCELIKVSSSVLKEEWVRVKALK